MGESLSDIDGYVVVRVSMVGIDKSGATGVMILKSIDNRVLTMSAFSPEVATQIERFRRGDRTSIPTVYKMIEELAETQGLFLKEVKIYSVNDVLRANLSFEGKERSITLSHYRASDAIALAVYYNIPIKLEEGLLHDEF